MRAVDAEREEHLGTANNHLSLQALKQFGQHLSEGRGPSPLPAAAFLPLFPRNPQCWSQGVTGHGSLELLSLLSPRPVPTHWQSEAALPGIALPPTPLSMAQNAPPAPKCCKMQDVGEPMDKCGYAQQNITACKISYNQL